MKRPGAQVSPGRFIAFTVLAEELSESLAAGGA